MSTTRGSSTFLDRIQKGIDARSSNHSSSNESNDAEDSNTSSGDYRSCCNGQQNRGGKNLPAAAADGTLVRSRPPPLSLPPVPTVRVRPAAVHHQLPSVGFQFCGRCHFVQYNKDTTPLCEVLNVRRFVYDFCIERVEDGVRITYGRGDVPEFRHWTSYAISYTSGTKRARYLANNTLPGMSMHQVTLDVQFAERADGDEFVRIYKFGRALDGEEDTSQ